MVSRSHLDGSTKAALARLPNHTLLPLGSSLKFALIAAGDADVYVRLAPTMAWDSAAGQAIVEAAGGIVLAEDRSRLSYSWNGAFQNPGFVAASELEHDLLVVSK